MSVRTRVVILPAGESAAGDGTGPEVLRIEEIDLPAPGPNQVVVRMTASGICQSQLNRMRRPRKTPVLMGHEATGVVIETGTGVRTVSAGDPVLLTWMPSPGAHDGRRPVPVSLPTSGGADTAPENIFTWAEHTVVDEQFLHPLPAEADPVTAAVVGCAVMTGAGAVRVTSSVAYGESVAVIGTGGVGLCAIAAAGILGADPVIAVDLNPASRALAREFGATHVVDPAAEDAPARIRELTTREALVDYRQQPVAGADHVFDFVATPLTLRDSLAATRPGTLGAGGGGTAVMVGTPSAGWELDPIDLLLGEKRVAASMGGSCVPARDLPVYLEWLASGRLPLEKLVTRRVSLDEINEATTALARGEIAGRAVIVFP